MTTVTVFTLLFYGFLSRLVVVSVWARAPAGPWDVFNYAPASRVVRPVAVRRVGGSVTGANNTVDGDGNGIAVLGSQGSSITLDFGIEVGGLISMTLPNTNTSSFALSFTESPQFISTTSSDDSSFPSADQTYDGILKVTSQKAGLWTQSSDTLRGGFRFLTIVNNGGSLRISNVTCEISFMPHVEDMRSYAGYFWAKDTSGFHDPDFLTKLWYAGAYTVQTNTVPLNTGRKVPFADRGTWFNNAKLGVAGPIIVDGAKRDRAVWPGDMGIAVPTQFVSTNDLVPTKNALLTMFNGMASDGSLPESGPPLSQKGSDTYHAWTLIGCYNYHLYSGDTSTLQTLWKNYTRAVAYLEGKVDAKKGLMNVTGLRDWARLGGGGINAEGNAILYRVLVTASELAMVIGDSTLSTGYARNATLLKDVFNKEFWVDSVGLYRDNSTTTLTPQDANSLAVLFNLTQEESWKARVSQGLMNNWRTLGPEPPELPDTISPFISGFELQAHFEANQPDRALDLLHRTWGYMLYTNLSVESTLLEGFTVNGSLLYRSYRGYNYDAAYTSHAHGWSSAPTSALTTYVLGLSVAESMGQGWVVKPVFVKGVGTGEGGVKGGFETPLGSFGVGLQWTLGANVTTPAGTNGEFVVPSVFGGRGVVSVDGKTVKASTDGRVALSGGMHEVKVVGSG
ncbi:Six-hairpin glycosidase [Marasmius fiardii PR-910]|nr:Six-hairpin glycosidase [Marasmius fiardii PR-910]